ncbi:MAG: NusG domain II-containing protein [Lachnospiraceae bacterium]|nr:NusG domain II-containing protein [Lachnospiraceae bacterium]
MKKNGFFSVAFATILLICVSWIFIREVRNNFGDPKNLRVFVEADGATRLNGTPLYGEHGEEVSYEFQTSKGKNKIRIKDGYVSVISADCDNQDCVHHVPIHKRGDRIVCLPHKFVVSIK